MINVEVGNISKTDNGGDYSVSKMMLIKVKCTPTVEKLIFHSKSQQRSDSTIVEHVVNRNV